jgi:hypothetical protein
LIFWNCTYNVLPKPVFFNIIVKVYRLQIRVYLNERILLSSELKFLRYSIDLSMKD